MCNALQKPTILYKLFNQLNMNHKLLIYLLLFLSIPVFAVDKLMNDSVQFQDSALFNVNYTLPPLDSCIYYAEQSSPLLKLSEEDIAILSQPLKMKKFSWLEYFQIDANARYGLYNQVTINQQTSGDLPDIGVKSTKDQLNYYAGLTFKLPLSFFFNNGRESKISTHNLNAARYKAEIARNELKKVVITEYYKLKRLSEILDVYQNDLFNAKLDYMKAKNDLKSGILSIDKFSAYSANHSKAIDVFVTTKNEFETQLYILKILIGRDI